MCGWENRVEIYKSRTIYCFCAIRARLFRVFEPRQPFRRCRPGSRWDVVLRRVVFPAHMLLRSVDAPAGNRGKQDALAILAAPFSKM